MRIAVPVLLVSAVVLAGCAAGPTASSGPLALTSPDLASDGTLPAWATNTAGGHCAGENRSPGLAWTGVPSGTESFALTLTDPANPSFIHWVVTELPADTTGVPSSPAGEIGIGETGANWQGDARYAGLCLEDNPYVYTLYALDTVVDGEPSTTHEQLLELIDGHVLESAELEVLRAPAE